MLFGDLIQLLEFFQHFRRCGWTWKMKVDFHFLWCSLKTSHSRVCDASGRRHFCRLFWPQVLQPPQLFPAIGLLIKHKLFFKKTPTSLSSRISASCPPFKDAEVLAGLVDGVPASERAFIDPTSWSTGSDGCDSGAGAGVGLGVSGAAAGVVLGTLGSGATGLGTLGSGATGLGTVGAGAGVALGPSVSGVGLDASSVGAGGVSDTSRSPAALHWSGVKSTVTAVCTPPTSIKTAVLLGAGTGTELTEKGALPLSRSTVVRRVNAAATLAWVVPADTGAISWYHSSGRRFNSRSNILTIGNFFHWSWRFQAKALPSTQASIRCSIRYHHRCLCCWWYCHGWRCLCHRLRHARCWRSCSLRW